MLRHHQQCLVSASACLSYHPSSIRGCNSGTGKVKDMNSVGWLAFTRSFDIFFYFFVFFLCFSVSIRSWTLMPFAGSIFSFIISIRWMREKKKELRLSSCRVAVQKRQGWEVYRRKAWKRDRAVDERIAREEALDIHCLLYTLTQCVFIWIFKDLRQKKKNEKGKFQVSSLFFVFILTIYQRDLDKKSGRCNYSVSFIIGFVPITSHRCWCLFWRPTTLTWLSRWTEANRRPVLPLPLEGRCTGVI